MKAVFVVAILLMVVAIATAAPSLLLGGVLPTAAIVQTAGVPNLHTSTINLAPVLPLAAHSVVAGHGILLG